MATKLPNVDVLIVGLGWTGGIIAKELAPTKLKIVALERGRYRDTNPDFLDPQVHDELKFAQRHETAVDVRRETITFRNKASQTAYPMRQLGSFLPGEGLGGAGVHWNGVHWRWLEWDHKAKTITTEKWGANVIPADMNLQDWPVTYDELEPYYDKFEKTCGTSGKAGNLNGKKIEGGNIFEAPRKSEYPNPPLKASHSMTLFEKAAKDLGYHPFTNPASNASQDYTNPDGVTLGQCHYCGFCERFGCEVNAKASPHFTVIPVAQQNNPNFEMRMQSRVLKVNLDSTGKKAVSVNYIDALGREFEQPADLIILSAYALGNVHLMLLSGIGKPYDPATGQGVVGRNYAYQCSGGATAFMGPDVITNPFMGTGALGMSFDDFCGDVYDAGKAGYIGGGEISCSNSGARPIGYHPVPRGTPRWGSAWKKAVVDNYLHTINIGGSGAVMAYKTNHLDLDPTYKDAFGRPLMRMTFDYGENERKLVAAHADVAAKVAEAMGAKAVVKNMTAFPYTIVPYQSTHNTGGAVWGDDPKTSALNRYCQSWDVSNVFVTGACVFPQNASKNPTGPVGAIAFWMADAIQKYLKAPGPMVHA
jgi:gluconate 2-dehydrogenase alpha chain